MRDGTGIKRIFHPPAPREAVFPEPPKGLGRAALEKWMGETSGKVDEAQKAENAKWRKERVPDTRIRIEFMEWAWEGRLLGEVGDKHVESIEGAWLDVHGLHLPDGRVVHGRAVKLPDGRIVANKAILDLDAISTEAEPAKPKRVKRTRRGKVHQYEGHEKWAAQSLIKGILRPPKGTPKPTDKKVVAALKKQAATHSILKGLTMPADRTLEGWVAMVRKGRDVPGATSGRVASIFAE